MKVTLAIILILFFQACIKTPCSYHETTGEKYECVKKDKSGQKQGGYVRYFEDGSQAETTHFVDDKMNGERKLYYPNGQIESVMLYKNGHLEGLRRDFYESGAKKLESHYNQNLLNGGFTQYYENGNIKEEVIFVNDLENGPFVEYYENGVVKWKGTYLNGNKEFGLLEHFDINGKIIKKMQCDSIGACFTIWKSDSLSIHG